MALSLDPPLCKMRELRADETIAHWQLDEASGTTVSDLHGASPLTSASSGNIVDAPFAPHFTRKGRAVAGASSTAAGASTAGQRLALLNGNWTIEAWIKPTNITGQRTIVCHGNALTDSNSANNYLGLLAINNGALRTYWETGSGTDVTTTSSSAPVVVGQTQHVAVRCRTLGVTRIVDFFYNGALFETVSSLSAPTGGGSGSWAMGALAGSLGSPFIGDLYEVRVAAAALSDEALRDSYARGIRTWDEQVVQDSAFCEFYARVLIENGGDWVDVTNVLGWDMLQDAEWGEDVDDQGATATISLRREVYNLSLAPLRPNAGYQGGIADPPLLKLMQGMKIETATVPDGFGFEGIGPHWKLAFDGLITDVDWGRETIKVSAFDRYAALQDVWIEPDYGSTPPIDKTYSTDVGSAVEGVLQDIIDQNEPATIGYKGGLPAIYTPTSPAWNVKAWIVPPTKSVASELENVVSQIGWNLRFRIDDARQESRLTFYEPDRGHAWASGEPVLSPGAILEAARLELSRDDIRNVVEVEYGDSSTEDNTNTIKRQTVIRDDTASILLYGRRYCRIGVASTSQIDDTVQAVTLAESVLADLKDPKATYEVGVAIRPWLQLQDTIKVEADRLHFDTDQTFAVVALRHSVTATSKRTRLTLRASGPVSVRWRWFDRILVVGAVPGQGLTPVAAPTTPAVEGVANGVRFRWDYPNRKAKRYVTTEVHVSTSNGFSPSDTTLTALVPGKAGVLVESALQPGTVHYARFAHRDAMGNVSGYSSQVAFTPRYLSFNAGVRATLSGNQTIATSSPDDIAFDTKQAGTDAQGNFDTGTSKFTAPVSGLYDIDVSALYDSDGKPGATAYLTIERDGTTARTGATGSTGAGDQVVVTAAAKLWVPAGQTIKAVIYHGSGNSGSAVIAGDDTFFHVILALQPS